LETLALIFFTLLISEQGKMDPSIPIDYIGNGQSSVMPSPSSPLNSPRGVLILTGIGRGVAARLEEEGIMIM